MKILYVEVSLTSKIRIRYFRLPHKKLKMSKIRIYTCNVEFYRNIIFLLSFSAFQNITIAVMIKYSGSISGNPMKVPSLYQFTTLSMSSGQK